MPIAICLCFNAQLIRLTTKAPGAFIQSAYINLLFNAIVHRTAKKHNTSPDISNALFALLSVFLVSLFFQPLLSSNTDEPITQNYVDIDNVQCPISMFICL